MKILRIYKFNEPFEKVRDSLYNHCKVADDMKQSIVEEITGTMSASGLISIISFTAGGVALMADPVMGTIIITVSIVYGTAMKVWSARFFQRHFSKHELSKNIDTSNLEENLMKVLKNSPVIRTGTSNYGFVRLLSRAGLTPTLLYSKTVKDIVSPQTTPKGRGKTRIKILSPFSSLGSSPEVSKCRTLSPFSSPKNNSKITPL